MRPNKNVRECHVKNCPSKLISECKAMDEMKKCTSGEYKETLNGRGEVKQCHPISKLFLEGTRREEEQLDTLIESMLYMLYIHSQSFGTLGKHREAHRRGRNGNAWFERERDKRRVKQRHRDREKMKRKREIDREKREKAR